MNETYKTSEVWLYILYMFVWAPAIGRILNAIVLRIPIISFLGPEMQHIATFISALFAFRSLKLFIRNSDVFFYVFCVFFYLLNYALYPQNSKELDTYFVDVIVLSLPAYFVGLAWDINRIDKFLYYVSAFSICYSAFSFLFYSQQLGMGFEENEYHMGAAYALLPHTIYIAWHLFRKFRIVNLLFFLLGLLMLFSFGTRGPIVCISMFILVFILIGLDIKNRFGIMFISMIVILSIIINFESILLFMSDFLSDLGMSNRIIQSIIMGEVLDDSGRGIIRDNLLNAIAKSPLQGYGLFGSWRFVAGYSHRIDIDFLITFGIFVGSALLFYLVYLLIETFRYANRTEKGFLLVLLFSSIAKLMFSGLFLFDTLFFLLLGYCVGRTRISKFKFNPNIM